MPDDIRKRPRANSRLPSERNARRTTPVGNGTRNEPSGGKPGRNARPLITVFGSSRARDGDELYVEAWRMGQLLGQSGFDVATGGYSGVMEAVSRGAHEAGAHVVGVTMKPFGETVNPYVVDEIAVRDFYARLRRLVDRSQGYVVMRGGMGTLAELTFTWQLGRLSGNVRAAVVALGANANGARATTFIHIW